MKTQRTLAQTTKGSELVDETFGLAKMLHVSLRLTVRPNSTSGRDG